MRILLFCSNESTYVLQIWRYLKKSYPQIQFSLFTSKLSKQYYQDRLILEDEEKIYTYSIEGIRERMPFAIARLPRFDIMHFLWNEYFWWKYAFELRRKADYWFYSVGGSDLYIDGRNKLVRLLQKRLIKRTDWISSENVQTREHFFEVYGQKYRKIPHSIIPFGVDILDSIDEQKENGWIKEELFKTFPKNKKVVVCGTNAKAEHNHFQILDAIAQLTEEERDSIFFVFPLTYPQGRDEYIAEIEMKIKELSLHYIILRKFMNVEEMAQLAMLSDILIHVQKTDQLSSAMISHMYNGNLVIAGSWLPYRTISENGVFFITVDKISELTECLRKVLKNIAYYKEKCRMNGKIIYKMSSWEISAAKWFQVYNNLIGKESKI